MTVRSATDALPELFGRYRILRKLGQGGMGAVYLALDTALDREVALKVPSFTGGDSSVPERFQREARAAAALDHPNICPVYDVGVLDGVHYLTMPYIQGMSLAELLRHNGQLAPSKAASIVCQLATALAQAHLRGVIHRDLKPSNVLLNEKGDPIITDFGLARRVVTREGTPDPALSTPGALLGTPAYMSPEQVGGDPTRIDHRCDVWALGVILYELITGRPPFAGPVHAVLGQILATTPEPPSRYCAGLDPQLEAIVFKAMAREPEQRYADMTKLADALVDWLSTPLRPHTVVPTVVKRDPDDETPTLQDKRTATIIPQPTPTVPIRRDNNRLFAVLGGVLVVALVGLGVREWRATQRAPDPVPPPPEQKPVSNDNVVQQPVIPDEPPPRDVPRPPRPPSRPFGMKSPVRPGEEVTVNHIELVRNCRGHTERVRALAFSFEGGVLASGGDDRSVRLWRMTSEDRAADINIGQHTSSIVALAFSSDGTRLVSASASGTAREVIVWELDVLRSPIQARQRTVLRWQEKKPIRAGMVVAITSEGRTLAVRGDADERVRVWDLSSGEQKPAAIREETWLWSLDVPAYALAFSIEGGKLLGAWCAGDKEHLGIWDVTTRKVVGSTSLPGGNLARRGAVWFRQSLSAPGLSAKWVRSDGSVMNWSRQNEPLRPDFYGTGRAPLAALTALDYPAMGDTVLVASVDPKGAAGALSLWWSPEPEKVLTMPAHAGGITAVALGYKGVLLAAAGADHSLKVWEVPRRLIPPPRTRPPIP